jgi:hypothetical protein
VKSQTGPPSVTHSPLFPVTLESRSPWLLERCCSQLRKSRTSMNNGVFTSRKFVLSWLLRRIEIKIIEDRCVEVTVSKANFGSLFFKETADAERYQNLVTQFISVLESKLKGVLPSAWWGDGWHSCSAAGVSWCAHFGRGLWPPRSPDLTPPHFFLWWCLKERVHSNKPGRFKEIKQNTEQIFINSDPETVLKLPRNALK